MECTTITLTEFSMGKQVWIGLVGVVPRPGSAALGNAKGGFTNALALVTDPREFERQVTEALDELGLIPYEFEDIESFTSRIARCEVDEAIKELAPEVERTGNVRLGTFYNFSRVQ